jgi:hypothetical protein
MGRENMKKKSLLGLALLASAINPATATEIDLDELLERVEVENVKPSSLSITELTAVLKYYRTNGKGPAFPHEDAEQMSLISEVLKRIIREERVKEPKEPDHVRCMRTIDPNGSVRCMRILDPSTDIRCVRGIDAEGSVRCMRIVDNRGSIRCYSILDTEGSVRCMRAINTEGSVRCMRMIREDAENENEDSRFMRVILDPDTIITNE